MANSIDKQLGRGELINQIRKLGTLREYLSMCYLHYKKDLTPLELLDQPTKERLWKLSQGCKDRVKFCQALWYYENIC
jgi:hypothetical protein